MSTLKSFHVTITDVVDWIITLTAETKGDAYEQAWELFQSSNRNQHFRDHCETSTDVEEVRS